MIYMTGSDLETYGAAATTDITEMLRSGMDTEQVQVIVATGGAKSWFSNIPNDTVTYYRIQGEEPEELARLQLSSMGSAATLTEFLANGYEYFPAEHYALILWDHGGGPMEGVCYDELFLDDYGKKDTLTLEELAQALYDSPFSTENKLSFIGFDACMMGSVETAAVCAPFADYMIASEETEPEGGWNYDFLQNMENDTDGSTTGQRIIDTYFQGVEENTEDLKSLSCISLSEIGSIEESSNELFNYLNTILDADMFSQLSRIRRDAQSFGRNTTGSDYDLVDFCSLVEQYIPSNESAAQKVLDAINNAVIYKKTNLEGANGLSIYYPYYNKYYFENVWRNRYMQTGFSAGYKEYLEHYAALWLGEPLTSFEGLQPEIIQHETENAVSISLELTPLQAEYYASADLAVMYENSNGEYSKIWETNDVQYENGILSSDYTFEALYLEDAEGRVSSPITYYMIDDACFIHVILQGRATEEEFNATGMSFVNQDAWLRCKVNDETGEVEILNIIRIDNPEMEEYALYTGKNMETLDPEQWYVITFLTEFADSPEKTWIMHGGDKWNLMSSVGNTGTWKLVFRNDVNYEKELVAQFVIKDAQANTVGSSPVIAVNQNEKPQMDIYQGQIVDSLTELGIPDASVVVEGGGNVYTTVTDAEGYYTFDYLPDGNYTVTITGAKYNALGEGYKEAPALYSEFTIPFTFNGFISQETSLPFFAVGVVGW